MKSFLKLAVPAVVFTIAVALTAYLVLMDVRPIRLCAAAKMVYQETGKVPASWADVPDVAHLVQHPDGFAYQLDCDQGSRTCTIRWLETIGESRAEYHRSCGSLDAWAPEDFM